MSHLERGCAVVAILVSIFVVAHPVRAQDSTTSQSAVAVEIIERGETHLGPAAEAEGARGPGQSLGAAGGAPGPAAEKRGGVRRVPWMPGPARPSSLPPDAEVIFQSPGARAPIFPVPEVPSPDPDVTFPALDNKNNFCLGGGNNGVTCDLNSECPGGYCQG